MTADMPDVALILIAGGLMLAASVPRADGTRPTWARCVAGLALLLALGGTALAATLPRHAIDVPEFYRKIQATLIAATCAVAFLHFTAAMSRATGLRRAIGVVGFAVAVLAGSNLLHESMLSRGTAIAIPPKALSIGLQTVASAGVGVVPGIAFAYALFPLFGVVAALPVESARAFRRIHRTLLFLLTCRAALSVGGVMLFSRPPYMTTQPIHDLELRLAAARWVLGFVAPLLFVAIGYRRAAGGWALSASAVLLVAALCATNGEAIALVLIRETGLPF